MLTDYLVHTFQITPSTPEGALTPNHMLNDDGPKPRVYVACLASYNRGILFGRWLDAAQEADELREEIRLMLEDSPIPNAKEWAIHDHEGFSPLTVGEYENLTNVTQAAKLITDHREVAAHVLLDVGGFGEHKTAREALENLYIGAYDSVSDWVEELLDEGVYGPINQKLRAYIASDRLARDLELSGDIQSFEVAAQVHLFWSR